MPRIVNKRYREFLDSGVIDLFSIEELDKGLQKAGRSKYSKQGRAFLIALYYCGARPVEILQLKPMNFSKKKTYLTIQIPTAKRGVPRVISIPFARKHVTELYKYATSLFDDVYIFYDLTSYKTRFYETKPNKRNNFTSKKKRYTVITDRVYYYIKKWIGVNPYFLRHSRLSSLAQSDASMNELRQFKGAKSFDSVYPYMHMSTKMSKNIGRKLK